MNFRVVFITVLLILSLIANAKDNSQKKKDCHADTDCVLVRVKCSPGWLAIPKNQSSGEKQAKMYDQNKNCPEYPRYHNAKAICVPPWTCPPTASCLVKSTDYHCDVEAQWERAPGKVSPPDAG